MQVGELMDRLQGIQSSTPSTAARRTNGAGAPLAPARREPEQPTPPAAEH
jgi:hypothetical protein